jgi:hypothetical protein
VLYHGERRISAQIAHEYGSVAFATASGKASLNLHP